MRELEEKRVNKEMAHIRQKFKGKSGVRVCACVYVSRSLHGCPSCAVLMTRLVTVRPRRRLGPSGHLS